MSCRPFQVLRAKAQAAGNLKSGSQIMVVQQSPQVIVIQSANPQVVYVPTYNPAVVYGTPYVAPGYVRADVGATAVVAFGVGIAVGAMMSGGCCGWGYSNWNCGWHGTTTVVYRGGAYYGNTAWHGGYYGPNGAAHYGAGYNSATGTIRTWRHGLERLRQRKRRPGVQPKDRSLRLDGAEFQCLRELGSLDGLEERQHCLLAAQTNAYGTTARCTSNGAKAYGASGTYGNSAAVGQTANGNKYAAANGNTYTNTGSGWSRKLEQYSTKAHQGWGGQEKSGGSSAFKRRRRRLAIQGGKCSRLRKQGGGGGWGANDESQPPSCTRTTLVSGVLMASQSKVWRLVCHKQPAESRLPPG